MIHIIGIMPEPCLLMSASSKTRRIPAFDNWKRGATIFLALSLIYGPQGIGQTQNSALISSKNPSQASTPPTDAGWPRVYSDKGATVAIHQPQVDDWKDFKLLAARSAVEIVPLKGAPNVAAVVQWEAQTDTNLENRTVTLRDVHITSFRAPGQSETETKALEELVTGMLPKQRDAVALDRVLAYLDPTHVTIRQVEISKEPPQILASTTPAILVMIDSQPLLGEIAGTNLNFIINTNWEILKEKGETRYYLLNDKQWLTAENVEGPWKLASKLPKDTDKIPNDENWADLKKALPLSKSNKGAKAPWVFVAYKPSELILLQGEPQLKAIEGTMLSEVTNTKSMLFYHNSEKNYYFLISGRWFRNPQLRGTWEYASDTLPPDFAQIPVTHARAAIRASVPGTVEAADAVLLAGVPQMAVVNRKEAAAQAKATYVGNPEFKPIEKTTLQYAVNSPADVIQHEDKYYLLQQGVWFVSGSPTGTWEVADSVPQEIYTIPPESPKHNTTYVYVTDSDDDTVTTAQTAGYMGLAIGVGIGVAVWGTGYYYPPYYYYGPMYPYPVYWGYPYHSYGAAAWYNPATGFYGRGGVAYGPYGGFGRASAYNPATGTYARRAGAWGPYQGAMGASFYNPRTGAWGGGYRYANAYQGWGQGVVQRGDQWAKGGYYHDSRGTVAGIRTSEGGRLVAGGNGENRGFVGRTSDGDLYAGKDGNIYRRDQNGSWQQRGQGGWNNVNYDSLSSEQRQRVDQAKSKTRQPGQLGAQASNTAQSRVQSGAATRTAQPQASTTQARPSRDTMSGLNGDAGARTRGNQNYGYHRAPRSGGFGGQAQVIRSIRYDNLVVFAAATADFDQAQGALAHKKKDSNVEAQGDEGVCLEG